MNDIFEDRLLHGGAKEKKIQNKRNIMNLPMRETMTIADWGYDSLHWRQYLVVSMETDHPTDPSDNDNAFLAF